MKKFLEILSFGLLLSIWISAPSEGSTLIEEARLLPSDGAPSDGFGASIDVDGLTVVVGAPWDSDTDSAVLFHGSAYVFEANGSSWIESQKLLSQDGASESFFGHSVALDGSTIVVGAPWHDRPAEGRVMVGSAYVFEKIAGTWTRVATLTAGADSAAFDYFGHSVSIDGSTIVVGSPGDGSATGSVHVFEKAAGIWVEVDRLLPPGGSGGERFGAAVSVSSGSIAVGASGASKAYLYRRTGSTWQVADELFSTARGFAASISIGDDRMAAGAPGDRLETAGELHLFEELEVWAAVGALSGQDSVPGDRHAASTALDGHWALVGSPDHEGLGGAESGASYLFSRSPG